MSYASEVVSHDHFALQLCLACSSKVSTLVYFHLMTICLDLFLAAIVDPIPIPITNRKY